MRIHFVVFVLALSTMGAAQCSRKEIQQIGELRTAWVAGWNAKELDKVMALYTSDAVYLPSDGTRVTGQADIKAFFEKLLAAKTSVSSVKSNCSGDMAYDSGTYTEDVPASGDVAAKHIAGNYMVAMRRTGGKWLLVQHASTASAASTKERAAMTSEQGRSESGRILGIGGIFFKSANQKEMREWYGKHLGLEDKGGGVMLPWREKDNPDKEHVTVWTVFPANTKYFEPEFMVNYIVDDLEALLERLQKEGVKIDPKRQEADYGRFAWIYDPDGNKIELWQPLTPKKK